MPRFYSAQSRFLGGLTLAAIVVGALFATGFSLQIRQVLENEVRERAELILSQAESVQRYVRRVLRPRMYQEVPDKFIIEAMSTSFVSRSVMEGAKEYTENLLYRRVAVNARNPQFEATPQERELIAFFAANPQVNHYQGRRYINGVEHFVTARPVRFERGCMHCHGAPDDAPPEVMERYGERGFGHQEGSIGGMDFVGLPMTAGAAKIQRRVMVYLLIFTCSALLFFAASHLVFKRVVVGNLRGLAQVLQATVDDDTGEALARQVQSRDEIASMVEGVEQLSEHLTETRRQLREHAATLEDKVEQRTRELSREMAEREADVALFVDLLASFHGSQTRPELWRRALPLIARRFGLTRAAYVCTLASHNSYAWPPGEPGPQLPADWVDLLTSSRDRLEDGRALVPVESSEGHTEGILFLERRAGESFAERDRTLLRALGRQLGIAADYLGALDSILRHSEKLQSIFEGISDPLLLMDAGGRAIVTNQAARDLAGELSTGQEDGELIPLLCVGQGPGGDCDISRAAARGEFASREVATADGRTFALGLHPVAGTRDEAGRVVVHVREVTDERRLFEQMSRAERLASVGKLAAGLAHELNNPLGVIRCYAELLAKSAASEEQKSDAAVILKHTEQAKGVLRDLLDFARPKAATDRDTDLAAAAREVAGVFAPQAAKRGAEIGVAAPEGLPPVRVEPQVVEHMLANLLLNALEVLPAQDGRITVGLESDPAAGEVVLRVADNGPGIPAEDLPHVFDPFFTTKEVGKGTGLGLTVIYGFMRDLGGRVEAANRPGGGAVFTLRFPLRPKAAEAGSEAA
jgi:signal transduction histidine kinase